MRLIDADALQARIMMDAPGFMDMGSSITKAFIMAMVGSEAATPTVDAAQIVHCKDCIYWEDERARMNQTSWLPCMEVHPGGKWYCADGRKKDGND